MMDETMPTQIEFTDSVPDYDLNDKREKRLAESLLIGYTKPYLYEED
jgi:hypothetical protein